MESGRTTAIDFFKDDNFLTGCDRFPRALLIVICEYLGEFLCGKLSLWFGGWEGGVSGPGRQCRFRVTDNDCRACQMDEVVWSRMAVAGGVGSFIYLLNKIQFYISIYINTSPYFSIYICIYLHKLESAHLYVFLKYLLNVLLSLSTPPWPSFIHAWVALPWTCLGGLFYGRAPSTLGQLKWCVRPSTTDLISVIFF